MKRAIIELLSLLSIGWWSGHGFHRYRVTPRENPFVLRRQMRQDIFRRLRS